MATVRANPLDVSPSTPQMPSSRAVISPSRNLNRAVVLLRNNSNLNPQSGQVCVCLFVCLLAADLRQAYPSFKKAAHAGRTECAARDPGAEGFVSRVDSRDITAQTMTRPFSAAPVHVASQTTLFVQGRPERMCIVTKALGQILLKLIHFARRA